MKLYLNLHTYSQIINTGKNDNVGPACAVLHCKNGRAYLLPAIYRKGWVAKVRDENMRFAVAHMHGSVRCILK